MHGLVESREVQDCPIHQENVSLRYIRIDTCLATH